MSNKNVKIFRERKGAFYTPQIWVELSQKYLTDVLGEDWQYEYTIWDCAAGTGNLLAGLTEKYNIWASTLDKQDVDVMYERIDTMNKNSVHGNGANLLKDHVFQFDFLNDEFTKLPAGLQAIISDPEKRKKLVIYINPPYAEADNRRGDGRSGVAESVIHKKYAEKMGYTKRELYVQFLTRIYCEISGCMLADFSTLKNLQAPKFWEFRAFFKAKLLKCFLVPANTFDNVKGNFPIGFKIWDTDKNETFEYISADLYGEKGVPLGVKKLWAYEHSKFINDWIKPYRKTASESIATIIGVGSDFQNQRLVRIERPHMKVPADNHHWQISKDNLIESSIYFAVRHCIKATWLNDRDQFLTPNESWQTDMEFQNDCLVYTLFNNNIQSQFGTNYWIPFTESEINARDKFASNFMTKFIQGKLKPEASKQIALEGYELPLKTSTTPLKFSSEAEAVFKAGRELWKYYHLQKNCNINASLYDIRAYFQGRNDKGKMNNKSDDEMYMNLIKTLRENIKQLQTKIAPKVFEYGFLK